MEEITSKYGQHLQTYLLTEPTTGGSPAWGVLRGMTSLHYLACYKTLHTVYGLRRFFGTTNAHNDMTTEMMKTWKIKHVRHGGK
jgi:hypothetical protein